MPIARKGQGQPKAVAKSPFPAASTSNGKFSLISDETLVGLYVNLLKCRKMNCPLPADSKSALPAAFEAALVGTTIDLGPGDLVVWMDPKLTTSLSGGDVLETLLARTYNGRNGLSAVKNDANGNSCSLAHAALGAALANKTARNGKIAVIYSTEPNSSSLRETIHIAGTHALPLIFIEHLDADNAKPRPVMPRGRKRASDEPTPWFPVITVDMHDIVAVYRVAYEAISRARSGQGPTVIECQPFVLNAKPGEGNRHHGADPLRNMEHYLRMKGLFDPALKRNIEE